MNEWKIRGKEDSPENTIKRIEDILQKAGFKSSMVDFETGVDDCFSCRLTISDEYGVVNGSNGKGMTRELSHASAYGEMIERVQNRMFSTTMRTDDDKLEEVLNKDDPLYDIYTKDEPEYVTNLFGKIADTIDFPLFGESKEEYLKQLFAQMGYKKIGGKYPTTKFYSTKQKKMVHLPQFVLNSVGSNGMAAGNTLYEACVEGISELLERLSHKELLMGRTVPPLIPDEVIDRYPHIRKVIDEIEKDGKYKVRVYDCSLGKKIPVVCGIIINTETGRFGMRFGAQPNMAIALERVFTEGMQGRKLEQFAHLNAVDFNAYKRSDISGSLNSLKDGSGLMPAAFFFDKPSYEFEDWKDVSSMNNKELTLHLIDIMKGLGCGDIYVRDCSYLGFPSVMIFVEGISDIFCVNFQTVKESLAHQHVSEYFMRLDTLTDEEVQEMSTYAQYKSNEVIENTLNNLAFITYREKVPGAVYCEADYLAAMCEYRLGNPKKAADILYRVMKNKIMRTNSEYPLIAATHMYLEGMASGTDIKDVNATIRCLCPALAEDIIERLSEPAKVLEKTYHIPASLFDEESSNNIYSHVHDVYAMLVKAEDNYEMDMDFLNSLSN